MGKGLVLSTRIVIPKEVKNNIHALESVFTFIKPPLSILVKIQIGFCFCGISGQIPKALSPKFAPNSNRM